MPDIVKISDITISNPCIKVCKMDGRFCKGCKRTMTERNTWYAMTKTEQEQTLQFIRLRKADEELRKYG